MPAEFEVDEAEAVEISEEHQDVDETPAPDPELAGTVPVFAEEEGDEEEEVEETATTSPEPAAPKQDSSYNAVAAQLRMQQRDNQILSKRLDMLLSQLEQGAPETEPAEEEVSPPDKEEDPIGYMDYRFNQLMENAKQTQEAEERRRQNEAYERAQREADTMVNDFRQSVGEEAYDEAIDYLTETTVAELESINPNMTTEEIVNHVAKGIQQQKMQWLQNGMNPGEMWMQIAHQRGWRPGTYGKATEGEGQASRSTKKADPRKEVQQMRKKQKKARSVSKLGGSSTGSKMTAKKALLMDEEQYLQSTKGMSFAQLLEGKARGSQS